MTLHLTRGGTRLRFAPPVRPHDVIRLKREGIMNQDMWIAQIFQSSVPLRRLEKNLLPSAIASGCLIDYSGMRILLTVSHATGDQKNWVIELRYEKGKGTKSHQIGAMNFLTSGSVLTGEFKDIDFSYAEVPNDLVAFRQELDFDGNVKREIPINIFSPNFSIEPDTEEFYGFAGCVKPSIEQHKGQTYVASELTVYSDLKFQRAENEFYVFKLPMKHPGHDNFKGCSGAPVIDRKGNVVALVCHGYEDRDEIYAISIKRYKVVLDILAGNLK